MGQKTHEFGDIEIAAPDIVTGFEQGLEGFSNPPISYAHALNSAARSMGVLAQDLMAADTAAVQKKSDNRRRSRPTNENYRFPSFQLVRKFDKTDANWRRFETDMDDRASAVGMQALRLTDVQVVLIGPDQFQAAMQKRFNYAAGLARPGLRVKESHRVHDIGKRIIDGEKNSHLKALIELTQGESLDIKERINNPDDIRWLDFTLDEIEDASASLDVSAGEAILKKADSLWQPCTLRIDSFAATGPRSYGVVLGDPLGVLRTETEAFSQGICAKDGLDFDRSFFKFPKSQTWSVELARATQTDLRYLDDFQEPKIPYDIPLSPPKLIEVD